MATAEGVLERVVQHGRAHVEEGLYRRLAPAHLLRLGHAPGDDLVHRALHERGRDRLTPPAPSGVGHRRGLVALEVAPQPGDALPQAADAAPLAPALAPRPATQGGEPAPASRPAPVP